nr:MAG TPA: hypothetical protein [Inoviridae sp.]
MKIFYDYRQNENRTAFFVIVNLYKARRAFLYKKIMEVSLWHQLYQNS